MLFTINTATFDHGILSVSQISAQLKKLVESNFTNIQVRGEVSNSKLVTSGHCYFSLKDANTVLDAVCWRDKFAKLAIKPQDGLEIICSGRVTTYDSRSKYQLVVDHIELAGQGALLKLLDDRKQKLADEGLFHQDRKKILPYLPRLIGIITSPTGAVIQDMLHRIHDRFPCPVLLWPVAVQGDGAAEQIAAAVNGFNNLPNSFPLPAPDLLIVARGGGSLEDLWAFNEEIVVRAIAASNIAVISGVGHEPDVTLTDLVADYRAPTPSAAAEKAVPVRNELTQKISQCNERLHRYLERIIDNHNLRLESCREDIERSQNRYFNNQYQRFNMMSQRLRHPLEKIKHNESQINSFNQRMQSAVTRILDLRGSNLSQKSSLLESYSFAAILKRGFALVKGTDGHIIKTKTDCHLGNTINIAFHDGEVTAKIV